MKSIRGLICAFSLFAFTLCAEAQGTINFNNTGFNITTNNWPGPNTGLISGQGNYIFGLYMAPDAGSLAAVTTPVRLFTNSPVPGVISLSTVTLPNGYAVGSTYAFQVKGWSSAGGYTSYEQYFANNPQGIYGFSAVGSVTLGGGPTPAGAIWGTGPGQIGGFSLTPMPEPSTIALAGLGAASLLLFRRRK